MFEDDNWDFAEDDLKDFIIEEFNNCSKKDEAQHLLFQNLSGTENKSSTNNSNINFNETVSKNSKNDNNVECIDRTLKKNTIINIFNNINHSQNNFKSKQNRECISFEDSVQSSSTSSITNDDRKNFVLNVFQQDQSGVKYSALISKPIIKSVLKITDSSVESENKLKRKKNVAFTESLHEINFSKKICVSKENEVPKQLLNNSIFEETSQLTKQFIEQNLVCNLNNIKSTSNSNNIKTTTVLELLKTPVQKTIKIPCIKQTVIRKFPGPAGLIPDDINDSEIINVDTLDENENNRNNKYIELCSQNTKNLYTTGAWRLMMDDLPANFELYDIATIKENAVEYSRNYKKVPYFAGIIQCIDYKPNDPHVILKDLTGKINAHIHHSICKLYPNALGNNVVILVKDAGLIVTSKKFVCMIISPKNLISIYSDDVRLVETSNLEQLYEKQHQMNQ